MRSAASITVSIIVATGLTELNLLLNGKKSFQPVISGFVTGTILFLIAFMSVDVAVMLAYMVLLSSVLFNFKAIAEKIS